MLTTALPADAPSTFQWRSSSDATTHGPATPATGVILGAPGPARRLPSEDIGKLIRAYRHHPHWGRHPLAQEVVADWLLLSQSQVSDLETGKAARETRIDRLTFYAGRLGIPQRHLWFRLPSQPRPDWTEPAPAPTPAPAATDRIGLPGALARLTDQPDSFTSSDRDYHRFVMELVEWARRTGRRDVLQWISWAAASAAAAPVLHAVDGLDAQERERTTLALTDGRRVDDTVVDHIEAVLWRCQRQDDALGPQAPLDTVLAQRNLVRSLLTQAAGAVRDRLLTLYASLSRFAGWCAFELGNHDAAADYYEAARTAAHEAHNTALGAWVLCNMSHLATERGQPRHGVDHAVAAQGWAAQTGDLRLQAYAFDRAARAYAMDGQDSPAMRSIDQARSLLSQAQEPSELLYFYTTGSLDLWSGWCHIELGRAEQAVEIIERALATYDETDVRGRALSAWALGTARLRTNKPDIHTAISDIGEAGKLAAHHRSPRVIQQIQGSWRELTPWHDEPEVQQLRARLSSYGLLG